jgi:uncharacterized phage protein (TIGR01671 family)
MEQHTQGAGRVIKFRAYDKLTKQIYDAAFIDYEEDFVSIINFDDRIRSFDQVTLLQFTGLTHNGKDVYEGDILLCVGGYDGDECASPGVVEWDAVGMQWAVVCKGCGDGYTLYEFDIRDVIGNIYENPELLK